MVNVAALYLKWNICMIRRRQAGLFSIEPLICLLLISLIMTWVLYWQRVSYQQIQKQFQQIQQMQQQKGMTLVSVLISLLLSSLSVLAICQIHVSVKKTQIEMEDILRQQQVGVLFYLAMEPYLHRANYLGCATARFQGQFPNMQQVYPAHDPHIPKVIVQKTDDHNPVLLLQLLSSTKARDLALGETIFMNNCQQAELQKMTDTHSAAEVSRLENCWFYIEKSKFTYKNHKTMHTLFVACDHQLPLSVIRGIQSWQITRRPKSLEFAWVSESALTATGLYWTTNMRIYNAF